MEPHYAGFWKRALALSIDMMALYFLSMILGSISMVIMSIVTDTVLAEGISETANSLITAGYVMGFVVNMFYFTYFPAVTGQTLGKKILGVDLNVAMH